MTSIAALKSIAKRNVKVSAAEDVLSGDVIGKNIQSLLPVRKIEGEVGLSKASIRAKNKVYMLPATATEPQRESFFLYMAILYRASSSEVQGYWNNLLATMINLLYSGVISEAMNVELAPVQLTVAQLAVINQVVTILRVRTVEPTDQILASFKAAGYTKNMFELPHLTLPPVGAVKHFDEWTAMYGYLGVLAFAVNKDVTGSGSNALNVARYSALLKKYRWTEDDYPFLGRALGPSDKSFIRVADSWKRLPVTRRLFFTYAGKIGELSGTVEDEALFTTIRLMKWTDLAHVQIITSFLARYKWAATCPSLRASSVAFNSSIEQMVAMCPVQYDSSGRKVSKAGGGDVRDVALLPFVKAIHGDNLDVARRDKFLPLLFVAHRVLSLEQPTLAQYNVPDQYPASLEEFNHMLQLMETVAEEEEEESDATE